MLMLSGANRRLWPLAHEKVLALAAEHRAQLDGLIITSPLQNEPEVSAADAPLISQ